jgi:hypothetical protein
MTRDIRALPVSPFRLTHSVVNTRPDSTSLPPPLHPLSPHAPPQPAHLSRDTPAMPHLRNRHRRTVQDHTFCAWPCALCFHHPHCSLPRLPQLIRPASKRAERCVRQVQGGRMQMRPSATGGIVATMGACVAMHLRLLLASIASAPPTSSMTLNTYKYTDTDTDADTDTDTDTDKDTDTPATRGSKPALTHTCTHTHIHIHTHTHQQRAARKPGLLRTGQPASSWCCACLCVRVCMCVLLPSTGRPVTSCRCVCVCVCVCVFLQKHRATWDLLVPSLAAHVLTCCVIIELRMLEGLKGLLLALVVIIRHQTHCLSLQHPVHRRLARRRELGAPLHELPGPVGGAE